MNDYKVDENSLYDSMNKVKEAKRHEDERSNWNSRQV